MLALSFLMEGYSLLVATRAVVSGATAAGLSFWEYVKRGMDPTSVAVMLEDGAAVTGLIIAGGQTRICYLEVWEYIGSHARRHHFALRLARHVQGLCMSFGLEWSVSFSLGLCRQKCQSQGSCAVLHACVLDSVALIDCTYQTAQQCLALADMQA